MSVRVRREATLAFEAGLYVCVGLLCVSGGSRVEGRGCGLGIGVLPDSFNTVDSKGVYWEWRS
jgi:hypothetical protein